jgi:hypothetical protein
MRPTLPVILAAAVLAALAGPARAVAQDALYEPRLLTLPGGTRAQAMGRAGVGVAEVDAVFLNPAQLVSPRGLNLSAQRYGGAATLASLSTAMAFLGGGVGIGVQWLDFELVEPVSMPGSDGEPSLPEGGGDPASEIVATLGYARTYSGFRVGAAVKGTQVSHSIGSSGAFAADLGVARTFFNRLNVGVSAQNLGTTLELAGVDFDLPRRYTLGAAFQGYPLGTWLDLAVAADVPVYEDGTVLAGGGVELSYVPVAGLVFSGRVGARAVRSGAESPFTAGAAPRAPHSGSMRCTSSTRIRDSMPGQGTGSGSGSYRRADVTRGES